jgi:hypothetical protein
MADQPSMSDQELLAEIIAAVARNVAGNFAAEARREIEASMTQRNQQKAKALALYAIQRAEEMSGIYYTRAVSEGLTYDTPEQGGANAAKREKVQREVIEFITNDAKRVYAERQAMFRDGKRRG